jgi:hypothetical protein
MVVSSVLLNNTLFSNPFLTRLAHSSQEGGLHRYRAPYSAALFAALIPDPARPGAHRV